jgi:hypothetical protein
VCTLAEDPAICSLVHLSDVPCFSMSIQPACMASKDQEYALCRHWPTLASFLISWTGAYVLRNLRIASSLVSLTNVSHASIIGGTSGLVFPLLELRSTGVFSSSITSLNSAHSFQGLQLTLSSMLNGDQPTHYIKKKTRWLNRCKQLWSFFVQYC